MQYLDVTIRESVFLSKPMDEYKALQYLKYYCEHMPFEEIKYVEIGFLDNIGEGLLCYNEEYALQAYNILQQKFKMVGMIHPAKVDLKKWKKEVIQKFDLVRICLGNTIDEHTEKIIQYLKANGVEVSLNIIYIGNKTQEYIMQCITLAKKFGVDWICLADSNGSCTPDDIKCIVSKLKMEKVPSKLGIHIHDHFSMAMATALHCYEDLDMLDVSVTGVGKGGGNLCLEKMILCRSKIDNKEIVSDSILAYIQLVVYLHTKALCIDNAYEEQIKNLLVAYYKCNLKAVEEIETLASNNFDVFCKCICERGRI